MKSITKELNNISKRIASYTKISNVSEMYAVLIGDGYLAAATQDRAGKNSRYWDMNLQKDENFTIVKLKNVPDDLAESLENMGTRDQKIRDGYKAFNDAKRYIKDVVYTELETDEQLRVVHGI